MANLKNSKVVRKRISSVKNLGKITKSMQMIASVKVAKLTTQLQNSKTYINEAKSLLDELLVSGGIEHPFLSNMDKDAILSYMVRMADLYNNTPILERSEFDDDIEVEKHDILVVFTSSRGLCGAYNSKVIAQAEEIILNRKREIKLVCVGKKGMVLAKRYNLEVLGLFDKMTDNPVFDDAVTIFDLLAKEFLTGRVESVKSVYTDFISTLRLNVENLTLLPLVNLQADGDSAEDGVPDIETEDELDETTPDNIEFTFEPSNQEVVDQVLPYLLKIEIFGMLLRSSASEHSSRYLAMQNSTDSAKEINQFLSIQYNKARQSAITQEVSEIIGGIEALS